MAGAVPTADEISRVRARLNGAIVTATTAVDGRIHRTTRWFGEYAAGQAESITAIGQAAPEDVRLIHDPTGRLTLTSTLNSHVRSCPVGLSCSPSCNNNRVYRRGLICYDPSFGLLVQYADGYVVPVGGMAWPVFSCFSRPLPVQSGPSAALGAVSTSQLSAEMCFAWDIPDHGACMFSRDISSAPPSTSPFSDRLLLDDAVFPRAEWTLCTQGATPILFVGIPASVFQLIKRYKNWPSLVLAAPPAAGAGAPTEQALREAIRMLLFTFAACVPSSRAEDINSLLEALFDFSLEVIGEPTIDRLSKVHAEQLLDWTCLNDFADEVLRPCLEGVIVAHEGEFEVCMVCCSLPSCHCAEHPLAVQWHWQCHGVQEKSL